ncbi:MAG TPA: hypothetical protein VD929_11215 [Caulobacteraceae bacterium]|nr:hypothetical protein [Caulobacteraceae bacterium]
MKVSLTAVLALAGWAVAAGSGAAAERRLTGDDLRDLARRETLWCDTYVEKTDDCDAITLLRLLPDGRVAETSQLLIQQDPNVDVVIQDTVRIDGDRLCERFADLSEKMRFRMNGSPAPAMLSLQLQALFAASTQDLEGKMVCQAFYRDEATGELREELTVDGARREDLESVYRIKEGDGAWMLRPQIGAGEDDETVIL